MQYAIGNTKNHKLSQFRKTNQLNFKLVPSFLCLGARKEIAFFLIDRAYREYQSTFKTKHSYTHTCIYTQPY